MFSVAIRASTLHLSQLLSALKLAAVVFISLIIYSIDFPSTKKSSSLDCAFFHYATKCERQAAGKGKQKTMADR